MSTKSKPFFSIINGPNLNLLGSREPKIYGSLSFDDYVLRLRENNLDILLSYNQSNHEGQIIDFIHHYGINRAQGIILNPGGYTHTSIAIRDAILAIQIPVVEVHISDIHSRETFRHHSYITDVCYNSISGQGLEGYQSAITILKENAVNFS